MNDTLKRLRLSDFLQWELNPKFHDLAFLVGAIERFGFVQWPAVRGGKLYAGHGRIAALMEMKKAGKDAPAHVLLDTDGEWLVPYITIDHLTEQQAEKFAIQDNLANEKGSWDKKTLQKLFEMGRVEKKSSGFTVKQQRTIREAAKKIPVTAKVESLVSDVPDAQFPREPQYGVSLLRLDMQADYLDLPFTKWGSTARTSAVRGTIHFFTDDYKFSALDKNPLKVVDTHCVAAVEANFTTHHQLPRYEALYKIGRKRWMARFWQENGIKILVDLNVSIKYRQDNLLGVPLGWGAYCTRALAGQESLIQEEYELASLHCGEEPHLFVVYGGGKGIEKLCEKNDWVYVEEFVRETRDAN